MEFGSWAIINPPSLLALIPLLVMIILAMKGHSTTAACSVGIIVAALLMGQNVKLLGAAFQKSLSSSTAFIGVIIMIGSGLGVLMTEAKITQTLVYWIVKGIGVNTQAKGKAALLVSSVLSCGLLGTMGGGNSVIAPIMIPILANLGITPSVAAVLFKIGGEMGLVLGPLTGVTLITMEVTGLSYGELMVGAAIPFAVFFIGGAWFSTIRTQKRTEGKERYVISEDMKDISSIVVSPREKMNAIIFLCSFLLLIVYGIITKQGTSYALMVMIILSIIIGITNRISIDNVVKYLTKGGASQAGMLLMFISIDVLLTMVTGAGGFEALSGLLGGLVGNSPTAVMLIASVVGGFGIEAAAVAEIKIIAEMFLGVATTAGLPMTMFAISIIAATRITGSMYPTSNFAIALGVAQCDNTKEVLRALWAACASVCAFIFVWAFVGVWILT